jgi:hypothetical protein
MGGIGSGRGYQGGKYTTSDMRALDIRRLKRDGLLTPGRSFSWEWLCNGNQIASISIRTEAKRVILSYRNRLKSHEWRIEEYPVYLEWTPCNFGGQRAWFRCPVPACGRRVAILYGGGTFACRSCHQLVYMSQREVDYDLAARRANRVRRRLGWEPGVLNGDSFKPKGMHWRTFERLVTEQAIFAKIAFLGMARRLNMKDLSSD